MDYNQVQFDFNKKISQFYQQYKRSISDKEAAILFAQSIKLQTLKAPHSAIFPPLEEFRVLESEYSYCVSGYVDSQNSYGAMMRNFFTLNVNNKNGYWLCTDQFIDTAQVIKSQIEDQTTVYWFFSILGSVITLIFLLINF